VRVPIYPNHLEFSSKIFNRIFLLIIIIIIIIVTTTTTRNLSNNGYTLNDIHKDEKYSTNCIGNTLWVATAQVDLSVMQEKYCNSGGTPHDPRR
jgi:hypothetical protein